ncbi:Putative glycosyl hydrolase, family 13, catalytic domain, glycoside hydrolase superfamily [Septoria linicola]|uniref:Glycosyl hydrolase, family 13, catalytic domain, glycoside hydrolase superfamily n=1 Tax=Septoria linicola TaxID=215465 RepID=A0A9Q9B666_9PEZI|nr:Putative glycosyl hydrolase, family 13, catalytic domain, glycoside hydrolase superfamily [Septoria linicola]
MPHRESPPPRQNTKMAQQVIDKTWWKEASVYQIYPASFKDSNDDGLGDVPGIISKIPYIKSLGVDAIWLSPIYASPQNDMGYDISDYRDIHAPYGTLQDMQKLIDELHANQIKLLMDLVVNHTSDEHDWFKQSRKSKDSPKRDWYFWRDPKFDEQGNRKEPNNWRSIFGGSAWHFDETTQQYYLALFLPSQPDLNWKNADMRQATYGDMKFWLDRGVDGFRIDSMNLMSKHPELPDAKVTDPDSKYQDGSEYFASGPSMHDYIREMRTRVLDHYDVMTVGELGFTKDEQSVSDYVAKNRHELNMVFTGDIVDMDFGPTGKYTRDDFHPRKLRKITNMWQEAMPKFDGWNSIYLDNHDSGRSLSRYGSDLPEHRAAAAKLFAVYLTTLSGTPYLLAGQEFGMANLGEDYAADAYIDIEGSNYYKEILQRRGGDVSKMDDVLREMQLKARDHGRLPVQWDTSANAGFTSSQAKPWMTLNKDYKQWNAESQLEDPNSVMAFYKMMLSLRKELKDLLVYGSYAALSEQETGELVIGWEREDQNGGRAVVLLNFSDREQQVPVAKYAGWSEIASNGRRSIGQDQATLGPYGAIVLKN